MPGMNGLDLLQELRLRSAELPVIGITGRYDASLRARVRAAGAIGLLLKPVDDAELKTVIDRVMASTAGG
jgi:FixJ family two-component response regulator